MAKSWYVFMGTGDPTLFSNYRKLTIKHSCLCGNQICAIYAEGENPNPEAPLSVNIQQYINKAMVTGQLQPEFPIGAKKYVYLKFK